MNKIKQLSKWLVRPHPRLADNEDRRGAQLFAGLMLVHFAIVFLAINMINLYYVQSTGCSIWNDQDAWVVLAGLTVIGAAMVLLRQGFYKPAVIIYIINTASVALLAPFMQTHNPEIGLLASATIPILLTAMVFSYRWVTGILIGILATGITRLILASLPHRDIETGFALLVVVAVTGGLILALRHHLDSLERERHSQIRSVALRYRGLFNNVADGIFIVNNNGYVVEANPAACKQLDYTHEELIGMPIANISARPNFDFKSLLSKLQQTANLSYTTEHKRKDKSTFPIELNLTLLDLQGEINVIGVAHDITERKLAEEALQASESRFREMADLLPQTIFELDINGRLTYSNEQGFATTGYTRADLNNGINVLELFGAVDRKRVATNIKLLLNGLRNGVNEYTLRRKDGSEFLAIVYSSPITHEGKILGIRGIVVDITERKRIEEEKYKLAAVIEHSTDLVNLSELDGKMIFLNDAGAKMLGIDPNELTNHNIMEVIPEHLLDLVQTKLLPTIESGSVWEGDLQYKNVQTNKCTDVHAICFAVKDPNTGKPIYLANVSHDITERKRAEEAVRASEYKFRNIAENMFDVIFTYNPDSSITYVSPSVNENFGYLPEELIGHYPNEIHSEKDWLVLKEIFNSIFAGKYVVGGSIKLIRKDGTLADTDINVTSIIHDGLVVGSQAIIRDVTETKRLRDLESRSQRLETAGRIAGQVAHDFNNLLSPLVVYPEMIKELLPVDHPILPFIIDMECAAQQIAEINQQLLTLGRRGHYNLDILNLNGIVSQAVRDLGQVPDTLVCKLELAENLFNIRGGSGQLHRVINNLLNNARDAMRDIGQITIKTENYYVDDVSVIDGRIPKGEYVKLTISDTGCGIPEDIIPKIFDPFFTTKVSDKKRGSGLGMSVIDAVIKDHNGYISLSTKVGQGTSFYLYFPITREAIGGLDTESIVGGKEKILIIDDDDMQCKISKQLLTKLGYDVITAESGEKAIELLKGNPIDLLVLDMIMPPGIDGTETYRRILEINPSQKAIIISGFSESDRVIEAQRLGVGVFIRKPLTRKTLAAAVRTELDRQKRVPVL